MSHGTVGVMPEASRTANVSVTIMLHHFLSPMNVLLLAVFMDYLSVALVVPNLIFRFTELGGTPESYGLLSSAYAASQLIGGVAIGFLADGRLGRKRALQLSFLGAGLSYLVVGLSDTIFFLVVSRVVVGLTKQTMTCSTAMATLLSDEASRTQALGRLSSTMTFAFIVGQSAGGVLSQRYGRRAPCFVASGIFGLNLCLVETVLPAMYLSAKPRLERPHDGTTLATLRASLLRSREALHGVGGRMLLLRLLYGLLLRSSYSMHSLYESREWAVSPAVSGTLASYNQLLGLAIDWMVVGKLVSRVPESRLLCICLLLASLNSGLEHQHRQFYVYAGVHLPVSAVLGRITRTCIASIFSKAVPTEDMGVALSVLDVCNSAINVIAPLYGGLVIGRLGIAAQPLVASAHYLLLLPPTWLVVRAVVPPAPADRLSKKKAA
jgi:MFS family permease